MGCVKNIIIILTLGLLQACDVPEDQILFSSSRNGNSDIYMMDKDGENIEAITESKYEEWGPVWINKKEISFLRQLKDEIIIVKKDLDSGKEIILDHPNQCILDDKNYVYSPAGDRMLYICDGNIFLKYDYTDKIRNLTQSWQGQSNYPEWISEQKITFTNNGEGYNEIYILDIEYMDFENITNNTTNDERGSVSKDEKYMVFSSDRNERGNQDLFIKELNSNTPPKCIVKSPGAELIGRWSKDGQSIYWGSNKDGNWEIYRYDMATESSVRLTDDQGFDGDPRVF